MSLSLGDRCLLREVCSHVEGHREGRSKDAFLLQGPKGGEALREYLRPGLERGEGGLDR